MVTLDVTGEVAGSVLFLLLCVFGVLVYIAYLLKRTSIGGRETVIEKHFVGSQPTTSHTEDSVVEEENEDDRRSRIQQNIDLDARWNKNKKVETNVQGIGNKEVTDGKGSHDAVNLMRKMSKGETGNDG